MAACVQIFRGVIHIFHAFVHHFSPDGCAQCVMLIRSMDFRARAYVNFIFSALVYIVVSYCLLDQTHIAPRSYRQCPVVTGRGPTLGLAS